MYIYTSPGICTMVLLPWGHPQLNTSLSYACKVDVSIDPSFEGKTMTFFIDGNVCERYQCLQFLSLSKREVGFYQSRCSQWFVWSVDGPVALADGGVGGGGGVLTIW